MEWDVAIVGAGIIGLACAERLTRAGMRAVVFERNRRHGQETSSRNSQVIHAGIYYAPDSLKARLCVRGNRSIYAWCESHGVPHARTGKWIVGDDEEALAHLRDRAEQNGVVLAFQRPSEPNVIARHALFSKTSGIVDAHALMDSLAAEARSRGCDFAPMHALVGAEPSWALEIADGSGARTTLSVPRVVNAAGLEADHVARLAGRSVPRQHFVKGSYFRSKKKIVRALVYPIPPKDLAGLGVHATVELDGAVKLGPDVELVDHIDYDVDESKRPAFAAAARRFLRGIEEDDLLPDQAGVRPKLTRPGEAPRDFFIEASDGWVDLVGIESPGLTCALEIAEHVLGLIR